MNKFTAFLDSLLAEMSLQGRTGTSDSYLATYRSVLAFSGKRSITLEEVFCKSFLFHYQDYLRIKGCCHNTISSYMRVLRAIRNKAEKRKLIITDADLFEKLYTGSTPTNKRAISGETILRLNDADLSNHSHLAVSRDMFMLSFHLQGISFIDLAHLQKCDLKDGYITYHRRKTGGRIMVEVLPPAQELLSMYLNTDELSPYLLPLLSGQSETPTREYRSVLRKYNRHLKSLAKILGIEENLTSYVARHSWATAAYHIGVPTSVIGQAMGHHSEEVTRIYLASFNDETLSYANKMVWKSLFQDNKKRRRNEYKKMPEMWERNVSFLARERHNSDANLKRSSHIRKSSPF